LLSGTAEWDAAVKQGCVAPASDPLLHNSSVYLCAGAEAWEALKIEIREGNRALLVHR
jgi:hypothetical protein